MHCVVEAAVADELADSLSAPIGTAVVGLGYFGGRHAQCYSRLAESQLLAVVDPDPATRPLAERLGVPWLSDLDDLPAAVKIVSVATPVATHHALAKRLLRRGIDVLLEKPMAETPEQAKELCMLARSSRRILQIGHIERFNPAFAHGAVLLPRARMIRMVRTSQSRPRHEQLDVVTDLMIHDLDLVLYGVASELVGFHAQGHSHGMTAIDEAHVELHFSNGCRAQLDSRWGAAAAISDRRMVAELDQGERWTFDFLQRTARCNAAGMGHKGAPRCHPRYMPHDTLSLQLASFIRASRYRTAPEVTPEHGRAALELAQEIQQQILG